MSLGGALNSVASPIMVAGIFDAGGGTLAGRGAPGGGPNAAEDGANSVASLSMFAGLGGPPGICSRPDAIIVAAKPPPPPFAGDCAAVDASGSAGFGAAGGAPAGFGGAGGAAPGAPGMGNCCMPPTMVFANALGFGAPDACTGPLPAGGFGGAGGAGGAPAPGFGGSPGPGPAIIIVPLKRAAPGFGAAPAAAGAS